MVLNDAGVVESNIQNRVEYGLEAASTAAGSVTSHVHALIRPPDASIAWYSVPRPTQHTDWQTRPPAAPPKTPDTGATARYQHTRTCNFHNMARAPARRIAYRQQTSCLRFHPGKLNLISFFKPDNEHHVRQGIPGRSLSAASPLRMFRGS